MANPTLLPGFDTNNTNSTVPPGAPVLSDGYANGSTPLGPDFSYMLHELYNAANKSKVDGVWDWDPSVAAGGGYGLTSVVRHLDSIWISESAANADTPGATSSWTEFMGLLVKTFTHDMATDADYTLTDAENEYGRFVITDTLIVLTTAHNIIVDTKQRAFYAQNDTAQTLVFKTSAGTGIPVLPGQSKRLYCDGTNVINPATDNAGDSIQNMQALIDYGESTFSEVVVLDGYYSENDGGGGIFIYDPTKNKNTANGGTIIDPSVSLALQGTGSGLGCWVRQHSNEINVQWFGATGDGTTDDYQYIQNANDYVNTLTDNAFLYFPTGKTFLIKQGLNITTSIKGNNSFIIVDGTFVGTLAININDTWVNIYDLKMSGTGSSGITAMQITKYGFYSNNLEISAFNVGVDIQTYSCNFIRSRIINNATNVSSHGVVSPSLAENNAIQFTDGVLFGGTEYAAYIGDYRRVGGSRLTTDSNGVVFKFNNCSFDGAGMKIQDQSLVNLDSCYFESNTSSVTADAGIGVLCDGSLSYTRVVTITNTFFNNLKYAVYCRTQPKNLEIRGCDLTGISVCPFYMSSDIYEYAVENINVTGGSGTSGVLVHTGYRSLATPLVYYKANNVVGKNVQADSSIPSQAIPNAVLNYDQYNDSPYRTYTSPSTSISGTKSSNAITLTTPSEITGFNGGDYVTIVGTSTIDAYIMSVDYENAIIYVYEYTLTGSVTISQKSHNYSYYVDKIGTKTTESSMLASPAIDMKFEGAATSSKGVSITATNTTTSTIVGALNWNNSVNNDLYTASFWHVLENGTDRWIEYRTWGGLQLRPSTDNTTSLGVSAARWSAVYANTYYVGAGVAGVSGTFTTTDGKTVTATSGIITSIV